ncbi:unnamed protein product [Caretta caretta]
MVGLYSRLALLLLLVMLPSPAHGAEESQDQPVFSRIIEGQDAQEGRWPWQVSVQFFDAKKRDYRHICGGSLISAQWVVSAAHCFSCSQSCSHYNKKTKVADIALVRLEKPVKYTKFIRPISLPGAFCQFPEKTKCWVTGWGKVEMTKPLPKPKTLQELEIPIIKTAVCNDRYKTLAPHSPLGPNIIKPSMICAGYMDSPKGFCKGDSGGPLACQQDGTWYLAGVVSWFMTKYVHGTICADCRFPGVFTRVTAYNSWIRRHMRGTAPLPESLQPR